MYEFVERCRMDGMMLVPPTSTHATNQDWSGLYP